MAKRHFISLILALTALAGIACDDAPEEGRAIVAVSDINGGAPVQVNTAVATDEVLSMNFRWRPYTNAFGDVSEATPHGDIIITNFRVTWTDPAGGTVPTPREGTIAVFVPVYDIVGGSILLLTAEDKAAAPLAGASGLMLIANIEFTAREMGTEEEIKFNTSTSVYFN